MKKTIFYRKSNDENGDYWFDSKPYKEWFTLEDTLYEPNGNIVKRMVGEDKYLKSVTPNYVQDTFSDEGIIRRIALHISK